MDFPCSMARKPYIDVLDIDSIPDAVEEALRMLRQGIFRAMSANVEEQRAKAAAAKATGTGAATATAATTASSPANATSSSTLGLANKNSASSQTATLASRDLHSIYSAVTKRPRKALASETSTSEAPSLLINKTSNSTTNTPSTGPAPGTDQGGDGSNNSSSKGLMSSAFPASTVSQSVFEQESQTGRADNGKKTSVAVQENGSSASCLPTTHLNQSHNGEGVDEDIATEQMPVFQPSATREHRAKSGGRSDLVGKVSSLTLSTPVNEAKLGGPCGDANSFPTSFQGEATVPGETDNTNDNGLAKQDDKSDQSKMEEANLNTSMDVKTGVGTKRKAVESQVIHSKKLKKDATLGQKRQEQKDVQSLTSVEEDNISKTSEEPSKGSHYEPSIESTANNKPSKGADNPSAGTPALKTENKMRNLLKPPSKSGKTNGSVHSEVGNKNARTTLKTNETGKNTKPGGVLGGISKTSKAGKTGNSGLGVITNPRANLGTKIGKTSGGPRKVPMVTEDVSGSIETAAGASAAMAGASSGKRSGLKGAGGALLSLSGAKAGRAVSPAMALLRKKMSEGVSGNSNPNKGTLNNRPGSGSNGVGTLPKAQRELLAQRDGVLALGTHTVGHRGGGLDGKAPLAGMEVGGGLKRSSGAASKNSKSDVQFVPGSKSIKGVEPNGYTVSEKGEVRPKVTLAARTRVPLKVRQMALDGLFKAWKDDAKASEADALQNCLRTEQEIYAGCAGRIDYRAAMVGKLKEIRGGTGEKSAN